MSTERLPTWFDSAFEKVILVEGGYTDDPKDSGGETRWGITKAEARANGYNADMRKMPQSVARYIYQRQYWDLLNLDAVADLSQPVAEEIFDTAVNCGQGIAGKFLQRALNVLNREEADYADVRVDGLVGPLTVQSLRAFLGKRGADGEEVLLRVLNCLQGARYVEIAEGPNRKKNEKFVFGWFKQRVKIGIAGEAREEKMK
jgi:lysozyme family protein